MRRSLLVIALISVCFAHSNGVAQSGRRQGSRGGRTAPRASPGGSGKSGLPLDFGNPFKDFDDEMRKSREEMERKRESARKPEIDLSKIEGYFLHIPVPHKASGLLQRYRQEVGPASSRGSAVNRADGELKVKDNLGILAITSPNLSGQLKVLVNNALAESVRKKHSLKGAITGKVVQIEMKNEEFVDRLRELLEPRLTDQSSNPNFTDRPRLIVGADNNSVTLLFLHKEDYKEALGIYKAMGFSR